MTAQFNVRDLTNATPSKTGRDSFLDCIRALAAMLVLLTHFEGWMPGGSLGVSIFFCLSGFLICGILLRMPQLSLFNIGKFIFRRFARVWPAMALQVFLVLALMAALVPNNVAKYTPALWGILTFTSGYTEWVGLSPAILWTLRAEFWFYALFPLTLYVTGRDKTLHVILTGIVLGWSAKYLIGHDFAGLLSNYGWAQTFLSRIAPAAYTLIYLDQLMYGAFCAWLIDRKVVLPRILVNRVAFLWGPLLAIALLASLPTLGYGITWYLQTSAAAMLTAVVILHHRVNPVCGDLEPIATLGLISYSIYLMHAVVIDYIPRGALNVQASGIIAFTVTVSASLFIFRFEKWAMDLSKQFAAYSSTSAAVVNPGRASVALKRLIIAGASCGVLAAGALTVFGIGQEALWATGLDPWQERLVGGQAVVVRLACGINPRVCSDHIAISYRKEGDHWCEYLRQGAEIADYPTHWCNASPEQHTFSVYGALYSFDGFGRVSREGQIVGRMSMP